MNRQTLIPVLVLLLASLAGCSGAGATTTRLEIRFAGQGTDVAADVSSDLSSRPTQPLYDEARIRHADAYTAHDQLEDWSKKTGQPYTATPFNGSFGAGYFLTSIAGVTADGTTAYWSLSVNGESSAVGMSEARLKEGDTVTWTYTPTATGSAGNGSTLGLVVNPVQPTQGDVLDLTGTVARDATLSLRGGPTLETKAGNWTLRIPLADVGQTVATLTADDGTATQSIDLVLVRLASATFEAKYTASPGHADSSDLVWYDPDTFASASLYEGTDTQHPTHFTVHDFMVTWTNQTGTPVEYGGPGSFGFSVNKIDGIGQPLSSSLPPYWCYKINGASADLGISLQAVQPGDVVTWEYAGCM